MKYKNLKEAIHGYALASRYLGEAIACRDLAKCMAKDSIYYRYAMDRMRQAAKWAVSDGKYAFRFKRTL